MVKLLETYGRKKMPDPWKFHGLMLYILAAITVMAAASYMMEWWFK